jgi:hypothetical protein
LSCNGQQDAKPPTKQGDKFSLHHIQFIFKIEKERFMSDFTIIHRCGHLYGEGGRGYRELDPIQFIMGIYEIFQSRKLDGFSYEGVTYQSHTFFIDFYKYKRDKETTEPQGVIIRVNHGSGWEVLSGDYMLAKALIRWTGDAKGLFWLCWSLIEGAKSNFKIGQHIAEKEIKQAFIEGRIKKKKVRNTDHYKVIIEPKPMVIAQAS